MQMRPSKPLWARCLAEPAAEFPDTELHITQGKVPSGLHGDLYRNGPGRLERGGTRVGHWFDGDGAVLRVQLAQGHASASYRYVETAGLQHEAQAGRLLYGNYGMTAPGPIWNHWRRPLKNAANTSVIAVNDGLLALWEGGRPHALDAETLATVGEANLDGPASALAGGQPFSAHPKQDPVSGEIDNFGVAIPGPTAKLLLYRCDRGGRLLAQGGIKLDGVPMIHDCVMAGRYLVFLIPPVRIAVLPVLFGLRSYCDAMRWQPERGTQILIVDRETLELVARSETEPFYQWHFGNGACDEATGGRIVLDLARYPDFSTNQHLREVASGQTVTPTKATLWRMILDPRTAQIQDFSEMSPRSIEFPMVPAAAVGRSWQRTYVTAHRAGTDTTTERYDALACFDHAREQLEEADLGDGRYPSEPILAPDATDPTQLWLLSVVYDGNNDRGELWIYDAARLADGPECILALPKPIPLSFHGCWKARRLGSNPYR